MANFAIRVDNLSKQYRLGQRGGYKSLRDLLAEGLKRPAQFLQRNANQRDSSEQKTLWALENVSFEVRQGEVVGIIGRNGAGKSTLLKILSRITKPTRGRVEGFGRVGSLLEVGTGFHPELSGRENIFLNGAILGMKRAEIRRRFDEIVAFAEFEQFLDTPVKRYSSGMYMRLAFAVAAHMEPDILIVDEVLAVGDAAFQKKCLGKMDDVAKEGRTVLFVSHNMGVIQSLCSRAIFLRNGSVFADDSAAATVTAYLRTLEEQAVPDLMTRTERRGQGQIRLTHIDIRADENDPFSMLATGRPAQFVFYVSEIHPGMSCSFTVYDQFGQPVTYFDSTVHGQLDEVDSGANSDSKAKFLCEVDALTLIPGRYRINAAIMWNGEMQDHLEGAAFFEVAQGELMGRPVLADSGYGSTLLHHRWLRPV